MTWEQKKKKKKPPNSYNPLFNSRTSPERSGGCEPRHPKSALARF